MDDAVGKAREPERDLALDGQQKTQVSAFVGSEAELVRLIIRQRLHPRWGRVLRVLGGGAASQELTIRDLDALRHSRRIEVHLLPFSRLEGDPADGLGARALGSDARFAGCATALSAWWIAERHSHTSHR